MSIIREGWIHFTDDEMEKVCDFLDKGEYDYELRLLKSPPDKKRPWSIIPVFETQLQANKYSIFLKLLKGSGA